MSWKTIALMCALLCTVVLTGCHDDDDDIVPQPGTWSVSVAGSSAAVQLPMLASYQRLTVALSGYDAERDGAVVISSTEDWLTVVSDTLATDSMVFLATTTNDEAHRRTASLVFTSANNPRLQAVLAVSQLSQTEQDTNGADARSALYVGYGYDIYAALDNPMSVRTLKPVIDVDNLKANSSIYNFEAVHDSRMSSSSVETYAATTIHEMATVLTGSSSKSDIDIAGSVETCKRAVNAAKSVTITEQNIGYGMMTKTVASRSLDMGALQFLRQIDSEDANSNRLSLSYEFKQRLRQIAGQQGLQRRNAINALLLEYGTHVVVQADLGGKIDYAFTLDRSRSFRTEAEVNEEVRYTIGQLGTKDRTEGLQEVSSSKSATGAIQILGGSPESRQLLQADIAKMKSNAQGQLSPEHMQKWLASINYSAGLANDENLDVVHFVLMPLWDLVNPELRNDFIDATLLLAQRSDCQLPATAMGTDIYKIKTTDKSLFDFSSAGNDKSLCRILYFENDPVLEVCSEYVPKIRTDARVTVVYPIYRRHIRMNQGLFIGDGIHQPAFVSFSGSDCYVNPIDTIMPGTVIPEFYYTNGTLMINSPSSSVKENTNKRTIRDDAFYYVYGGKLNETPIVKVGSLFWTRRDINHLMGFCRNANAKKATYEQYLVDGTLYTQFYRDIYSRPQKDNNWIWGNSPNTMFEGNPNRLWFLPRKTDVEMMYAFLGFNPKALFRGQASGFNASFSGYYGIHDFVNKRSFSDGQKAVRYKNDLYVFATYHGESDADVEMLVLRKDYSLELMKVNGDWHRDYFPVRAVRGYMFDYPTLTTIKEKA